MPDLAIGPDLLIARDLTIADLTSCVKGTPCSPALLCHLGAVSCDTGMTTCHDTGPDPNCALLAYWPMDGDGLDVASGRDLTLYGGPGFADGLIGRALDLHHVNTQYAQRPQNDAIFDLVGTDFTIQAWLYFYAVDGEQTFIEKYKNSQPPSWTLTKLASQNLRFHGPVVLDTPVINFPIKTWVHVIFRRDAVHFDYFYNGQMMAEAAVQPVQSSMVPLLVGRRIDADGRDFSFNGRIDELAIWNRALSDAEIGTLYNGGRGRPASTIK